MRAMYKGHYINGVVLMIKNEHMSSQHGEIRIHPEKQSECDQTLSVNT